MDFLQKRLFSVLMIIGMLLAYQHEGLSSYKSLDAYNTSEYKPPEEKKKSEKRKRETTTSSQTSNPANTTTSTTVTPTTTPSSPSLESYTKKPKIDSPTREKEEEKPQGSPLNDHSNTHNTAANSNAPPVVVHTQAQGSNIKDPAAREDFDKDVVKKELSEHNQQLQNLILVFKNTKDPEDLKNLLQKLVNIADKDFGHLEQYEIFNDENKDKKVTAGNLGTYKHTLCKKFMEKIKRDHPNSVYDYVEIEKRYEHKKDTAIPDVIYFNAPYEAYVFDYKTGKARSSPNRNVKYDNVLDNQDKPVEMQGEIIDIHPQQ